jgi:large subunit ribosomal protein L35
MWYVCNGVVGDLTLRVFYASLKERTTGKSGAKKRFRLTASGKVRGSAAFLSHNLRRRPQKMKRQARGTMILNDADARIVKRFLPYA